MTKTIKQNRGLKAVGWFCTGCETVFRYASRKEWTVFCKCFHKGKAKNWIRVFVKTEFL